MQQQIDWDTYEIIEVPVTVIKHYMPEGGQLRTTTNEGAYYTFRAQTGYENTFAGKHAVEALGGFEYRESKTKSNSNLLIGYDDHTEEEQRVMREKEDYYLALRKSLNA